MDLLSILAVAAIVAAALKSAIKIAKEYERGVVFRLGRFSGIKGPGLFFIIPIIDKADIIDLRTRTIDVPKQRVITKDNVSIDVDAVVYFRVTDPSKAVIQVQDYYIATSNLAQTVLRDVLGQEELDSILTKREELNKKLQNILDELTDPWGVKVVAVTIKDVSLPESMLRAMAKQAEAEREKRSRIIVAEGELIASQKMAEAAKEYEKHPAALKLRELQTLAEIAREKNLIVVTSDSITGKVAALTKGIEKKKS
ncbi:MAG: slipin family protein [Candidatus Aenigmatarchaeota archaeon]